MIRIVVRKSSPTPLILSVSANGNYTLTVPVTTFNGADTLTVQASNPGSSTDSLTGGTWAIQ